MKDEKKRKETRARFTDETLQKIATEALKTPYEKRGKLAQLLLHTIDWGYDTPSLETIEKKITEARRNIENSPLEKPWLLTTVLETDCDISPILKVAEYCSLMGQVFTMRQAEWVSRLSLLITNTRALAAWSGTYSELELNGYIWHRDLLRDSNLELLWSMHPWELITGCLTMQIEWPSSIYGTGADYLSCLGAGAPKIELEVLESIADDLETIFLYHEVQGMPSIQSAGLSVHALPVYIRWLRYLSDGPKLPEMSEDELKKLLMDLRSWVKNHHLTTVPDDLAILTGVSPGGVAFYEALRKVSLRPLWLEKLVGYDPEVIHLKRHKDEFAEIIYTSDCELTDGFPIPLPIKRKPDFPKR